MQEFRDAFIISSLSTWVRGLTFGPSLPLQCSFGIPLPCAFGPLAHRNWVQKRVSAACLPCRSSSKNGIATVILIVTVSITFTIIVTIIVIATILIVARVFISIITTLIDRLKQLQN